MRKLEGRADGCTYRRPRSIDVESSAVPRPNTSHRTIHRGSKEHQDGVDRSSTLPGCPRPRATERRPCICRARPYCDSVFVASAAIRKHISRTTATVKLKSSTLHDGCHTSRHRSSDGTRACRNENQRIRFIFGRTACCPASRVVWTAIDEGSDRRERHERGR